jgi:hypothetical protein
MMWNTSAGLAFESCNRPWAFGPNVPECNEELLNLSTQPRIPPSCIAGYFHGNLETLGTAEQNQYR